MTGAPVATEVLVEIEALARALDARDREARRGPMPYADPTVAAEIAARRRRLLIELDTAGVLAAGIRPRLVASELATLVGYHDAASALRRYLASPARARLVRGAPPPSVLEAAVSLDWFRTPAEYVAEGHSPEEWLALCEASFVGRPTAAPTGRVFTPLAGRVHELRYRMEASPMPKLWRALREGDVEHDGPPVAAVAAPRSAPRPGFPLERMLVDGSYQITSHLWGEPERGCYLGLRTLDGVPVLVTLGSPQTAPPADLLAALALSGPGLAPLRGVGELVEAGEAPVSVLIEDAPPGEPLALRPSPLALGEAARLGVAIARTLEQTRARGEVLWGLRPERIYVDATGRLAGLAPRCERFWALAPTPGTGVLPCFDELYLAPEMLAGRAPSPASDVFSLCATLATAASGVHPFAARSYMAQITAIATGARSPWTGPPELAAVLERGLAVDPARRPTPSELVAVLEPHVGS